MIKKYKLGAVIPTVQYGNMQPEIELEGENLDELKAEASNFIESLWKKYGSAPLTVNENSGGKKETSFTGEEIMYDEVAHKYYDLKGNVLMSGSEYAKNNSPQFNVDVLIPKTAKSWGVNEDELGALWRMNGKTSTDYGTTIHNALETYHLYKGIGETVQKLKETEYNYALPKNTHIRDIVLAFDKKFGTNALVEVLVSDVFNKRAGRIDRLEILDNKKKICRVGDFKTNNDIDDKKLKVYQLQLSFYAHILMFHGWEVKGLDIYHYDQTTMDWNKIELEVLDLIK